MRNIVSASASYSQMQKQSYWLNVNRATRRRRRKVTCSMWTELLADADADAKLLAQCERTVKFEESVDSSLWGKHSLLSLWKKKYLAFKKSHISIKCCFFSTNWVFSKFKLIWQICLLCQIHPICQKDITWIIYVLNSELSATYTTHYMNCSTVRSPHTSHICTHGLKIKQWQQSHSLAA